MATPSIPDGRYVTAEVPPEMREGVELDPGVVALPTGAQSVRRVVEPDGQEATLTQLRFERPAGLPARPLLAPMVEAPRAIEVSSAPQTKRLRYDFPLLPGVQCSVQFEGEVTADHLEQLQDYIGVACKRLREQAGKEKGSRDGDGLSKVRAADGGSAKVLSRRNRKAAVPARPAAGASA